MSFLFLSMNFQFAQPSDLLKPYIKQYWALENTLRNGECCIQRIIPGGLPELILYLDHKPSVTGNKRSIEDRFLLNGQQNDYYDLQITESLSVFSIMFQPQGISRFFALPISELFNQSVPLKYLNKALAEDLEVRLSNAFTFRQ